MMITGYLYHVVIFTSTTFDIIFTIAHMKIWAVVKMVKVRLLLVLTNNWNWVISTKTGFHEKKLQSNFWT